jgi:hypothetical protein
MSKKSKKHRKNQRKHNRILSPEQRFDLLNEAKDGIFSVITFNKYRWGYENWVKMTTAITLSDYHTIRTIVSGFRDTQSKRTVLELLDDIERLR